MHGVLLFHRIQPMLVNERPVMQNDFLILTFLVLLQTHTYMHKVHLYIQGARGIAARFLKWSPASTVCPIMTKFSQYTPYYTCNLVLVSNCWQD
jgi:hypothetical protein